MKTLYLATYRLSVHHYMADSTHEDGMRLVWARDPEQAEYLLKREVEVHSSYCIDKYVEDLELTEAIGDQIDA